MAVNIHITIIELNALHTKRQNLFQELDAVIHLLIEAKHWRLRKSKNTTSLNTSFKNPHNEPNRLDKKKQNPFQELDAVIHLLMEAKHWGLRKSRNATSLNSRFKSLDTLKVKIISVTFRRVIRTNHKKASKIWRHENIQLGGCQS